MLKSHGHDKNYVMLILQSNLKIYKKETFEYIKTRYKTALILAAIEGHTGIIKLFLDEEAGYVGSHGTALCSYLFDLYWDIKKKTVQCECLMSLLNNAEEVKASQLDELMLCICYEDTDGAKRIILSDTPLTTDVAGNTALMYATVMGNVEIAKLLIEHRGDEVLRKCNTFNNMSALMLAVFYERFEIAKLLVPHEAGIFDKNSCNSLYLAIYYHQIEYIKLLIPHEAGMRDNKGQTVLMRAVIEDQPHIVALLKEYEADYVDNSGQTAYDMAVQRNCQKCISLLRD